MSKYKSKITLLDPKSVEVLIITSASKKIPEIDPNIKAISQAVKNINFIEETIENICFNTSIKKFVIAHDLKIDCDFSLNHHKNLLRLKKKYNFKLITSASSSNMPSQLSASITFKLGLKSIRSKWLLFWEHDFMFHKKLDWQLVNKCIENGGKMIRLNKTYGYYASKINLETTLKSQKLERIFNSRISENFINTNHYTNTPFISELQFCKNLWKDVNFEHPDWNGHFGGFIEGPVNQAMLTNELNLSKDQFQKKYPIYTYLDKDIDNLVYHRGIYEPLYLLNFSNFFNIILLLKVFKKFLKTKILKLRIK
ncbi:hypothetical protein OA165_02550 [Prochlorococcus sp. AH-736-A21]|nr:hypothetical protein [Prochlorococcus sp. AH-736-A21]